MGSIALLRALRIRQWAKNVFVLAPLAFAAGDRAAADPIDRADCLRTLVAVLAFSLASSAVYLVNDVRDVASDREHPEKRKRPIASGELGIGTALIAALALSVGSLVLGWFAGRGAPELAGVLVLYLLLNLAYSCGLKRVVLLDAFCIALGFLLRVAAGGLAAGADVSQWLFLCTFFLALFLALNKRRAEIVLLGEERAAHRASLREYSIGFLDQMVGVLAACTIVAYTMYAVDPATTEKFERGSWLVWSVPLVAFGLGRYMLLVESGRAGDDPTRLFLGGDLVFLLNNLAWAALVAAIMV